MPCLRLVCVAGAKSGAGRRGGGGGGERGGRGERGRGEGEEVMNGYMYM